MTNSNHLPNQPESGASQEQLQKALHQSKERQRLILESAKDYAIFTTDLDRRINSWNAGAEAMFGYVEREIINQLGDILFVEEDQVMGIPQIEVQTAIREGRAENERWHRRKDGSRFYGSGMTTPLREQDGTIIGVVKVMRDLTRQKQAEETLRQLEKRKSFLLGLSDAIRPLSHPADIQAAVAHTTMLYFKADRCYYCEINQGNAIIHRDASLPDLPSVVGVYSLREFTLLSAVAEAGRPFVVADVHTTTLVDEALRQLSIQLGVIAFIDVPIIKDGLPVGILCITQNTPRDWTELEVELAQETAERTWVAVDRAKAEEAIQVADRRKDEFLAMLSHELRNPLATLHNTLLLLGLTQGQDPSLSLPKACEMMGREVMHLQRMVDDLLDVSRVSRGVIQLQRKRVELGPLVSKAVEGIQALYDEQGRQLLVALPGEPIWVKGDPTRLHQVLVNLLTNGVKYTQRGGHVWVTLEKGTGQTAEALLRVRDDGIGLAADQLTSIFDVFVQVNTSLDRPQGGLGLGLTVVKQLVEQHGGRVEAQSAGLGKGSEFIVHLPALTSEGQTQVTSTAEVMSFTRSTRVLIVDDNRDLADTTTMIVRRLGYETFTRYGGEEAIVAAERLQPDAILLDIGMPGVDGYAACQQIRQQPWGKSIFIVALTGYGQEEDKQRSREAGFDAHLVKPVEFKALISLLASLAG